MDLNPKENAKLNRSYLILEPFRLKINSLSVSLPPNSGRIIIECIFNSSYKNFTFFVNITLKNTLSYLINQALLKVHP